VPQGSDISPDLFNIFTVNILNSSNTITATYDNDTAILPPGNYPVKTSVSLQNHLNLIENWALKLKNKINPEKSVHVYLTMKKGRMPPTLI